MEVLVKEESKKEVAAVESKGKEAEAREVAAVMKQKEVEKQAIMR